MQGFILKVTKVRDEDCIVSILTNSEMLETYRFYGARHSNITQGFKIDFELQSDIKFLPKLRGVMHLGFSWLTNRDKMLFWQQLMRLFYAHLKGTGSVDGFYFDMLENCAQKFGKQNPKRLIIETYAKILDFEGRLHKDKICFICDNKISDEIALARAFLPAHGNCINKNTINFNKLLEFYETKKSINLNDGEVNYLYSVVLEGF